ncbi:MAG: hypothetical protein M1454_01015 [Candidatus Thermoplasmatota archaeon]|nr:hypothetical protein [Candidatus Thermoplasmatota archaeon]MCL5730588.1 hypothetical protein [Candidatus Thermoplasmatota archaeon]
MTDLQSRASRKINSLISGILNSSTPLGDSCTEIVSMIGEMASSDTFMDDILLDSLQTLMMDSRVDESCKDRIQKAVSGMREGDFLSALLKIYQMIGAGNYFQALENIASDSRFEISAKTGDLIKQISVRSGLYEQCLEILCRFGIFVPEVARSFLSANPDLNVARDLLNSMRSHGRLADYVRLLEFFYDHFRDPAMRDDLISGYLKTGNRSGIAEVMKGTTEDEISDPEELSKLADIFLEGGDMEMAFRFSKRAVVLDPQLLEANIVYLKTLNASGRYEESYAQIARLGEASEKSIEIMKLKAESAYRTGRYRECIDTVNRLIRDGIKGRDLVLLLIRSYTGISDFHMALKLISENEKEFGSDPEILREKFALESSFVNRSQALQTAEKILAIDPGDKSALAFVVEMLYNTEEYETIATRFSRSSISDSRIQAMILSSELRVAKSNEELKEVLLRSWAVMQNGIFLDTVYEIARTDQAIGAVRSGLPQESAETSLLMDIIRFNAGLSVKYDDSYMESVSAAKSHGLLWAVCKTRFYRNNGGMDPAMEKYVFRKDEENLATTFSMMQEIASGKTIRNVRDSWFFEYPLSEFLAKMNRTEEAETVLEDSVREKSSDPFYWYVSALILYQQGKYQQALKQLKKGMQLLTNADFLALRLKIAIRLDEQEDIRSSFETIMQMGELSKIPYQELRDYLTRSGSDILAWISKMLEGISDENGEAARIVMLYHERAGDISGASRVSRKIMQGNYMKSDLLKHVILMEKTGQQDEAIKALMDSEGKIRDSQIEILLAEKLHSRGDFQMAMDHFRHAIDLGADLRKNWAYADSLIETRKMKEASEIIESGGFQDLRLKYLARQHDYRGILNALSGIKRDSDEWPRSIDFLVKNLWKNADIREALFRIFEKEHDRYLGIKISEALEASDDKVEAIEVRKKIMRFYPEDAENISDLAKIEAEGGQVLDALSLLKKSLGRIRDTASGSLIIDTFIKISYLNGFYQDAIEVYEANPTYINRNNAEMIIRSYIELRNLNMAEKIASRYVGSIIDEKEFDQLIAEIKDTKHFFEISDYTAKLLDTEYKMGRVLDMEEAVYIAEIPLSKAEEIYRFLSEGGYYSDVNRHKYEIISREVIQKSVRKSNIMNIGQLKINVIFNSLERRDIILAKNLYTYIRECISRQRNPDLSDKAKERIVKAALKERVRLEPLNVAYHLNLGIDAAMEILTLMNYIIDINRGTRR